MSTALSCKRNPPCKNGTGNCIVCIKKVIAVNKANRIRSRLSRFENSIGVKNPTCCICNEKYTAEYEWGVGHAFYTSFVIINDEKYQSENSVCPKCYKNYQRADVCDTCNQLFQSRNLLFKHLEMEKSHMV